MKRTFLALSILLLFAGGVWALEKEVNEKLLDNIPCHIKGTPLFLFGVWLMWTVWGLNRGRL